MFFRVYSTLGRGIHFRGVYLRHERNHIEIVYIYIIISSIFNMYNIEKTKKDEFCFRSLHLANRKIDVCKSWRLYRWEVRMGGYAIGLAKTNFIHIIKSNKSWKNSLTSKGYISGSQYLLILYMKSNTASPYHEDMHSELEF